MFASSIEFEFRSIQSYSIKVLEAESRVVPIYIHLDQAVLRARDAPRCNEVRRLPKAGIRRKLCEKRGRKR